MELKDAEMLFDSGTLKSAVITRVLMSTTYMLTVKDTKGVLYTLIGQCSKEHQPREFKTIDAAASNAQKIGFIKVTVDLGWSS